MLLRAFTGKQQNSQAPREGAGQRLNGGATDERARQRRGSRDIAGEECGDVPMRGIDAGPAHLKEPGQRIGNAPDAKGLLRVSPYGKPRPTGV